MSKLTKVIAAGLTMLVLSSGAAFADRDHGHRHWDKRGWKHGHHHAHYYAPPRHYYRPVVYRPVVYHPAPVYYPQPVYRSSGFSFWFD